MLTADSRLPRGWPARTVQPLTRLGDFIICQQSLIRNVDSMFTTSLHCLNFLENFIQIDQGPCCLSIHIKHMN